MDYRSFLLRQYFRYYRFFFFIYRLRYICLIRGKKSIEKGEFIDKEISKQKMISIGSFDQMKFD